MPPRLPAPLRAAQYIKSVPACPACQLRLASMVTTPASSPVFDAFYPIVRQPTSQPPSHKHPALRKSQLHRQYQSILRSSPILLIFQHNNLKASEWAAVRKELTTALSSVNSDDTADASIASGSKIHILNTGIFESALKVVEYLDPPAAIPVESSPGQRQTGEQGSPSIRSQLASPYGGDSISASPSTHGLSQTAWRSAKKAAKTRRHGLEPLLSGPLAALTFPAVSPAHVAAALRILAPGDKFPAPKRKASPGYYEPEVQGGLQKLMLLGARFEGKAMDMDGVRWVGGVEGGITGLRAQLVGLLSSAGMGLASALEGAGRSLYMTVESRRLDLEGQSKGEGDSQTKDGSSTEEKPIAAAS